jgi:MoaA/NifB/PqqE/SkfB family radical SAM enzyme
MKHMSFNLNDPGYLKTDDEGRLVPSPDLSLNYSIKPGASVSIKGERNGFQVHFPSRLDKIYIEVTSQCNLICRTCIRNAWDEPQGMMSEEIFSKVIEGLHDFTPTPSVFFGGLGEPLFHPNIVDMVKRAKSLNTRVEMISNGMLLTEDLALALVNAGLDMLWVSLDGASPESYTDIRLGANLPQVLENLKSFKDIMLKTSIVSDCTAIPRIELGIAFVAMKSNIHELPAVIDIGRSFGANQFLVSNILPYTEEMIDQVLYAEVVKNKFGSKLNMPRMDFNEITKIPIYQTISNFYGTIEGIDTGQMRNRCPFIDKGTGAISWDGRLSPCLPLLHKYISYEKLFSNNGKRVTQQWTVGNIAENTLLNLWNTPEHLAFREKVQVFDFAPCTNCSGCFMQGSNEEDCYGNEFPTCGGCLWAQGVIQCP